MKFLQPIHPHTQVLINVFFLPSMNHIKIRIMFMRALCLKRKEICYYEVIKTFELNEIISIWKMMGTTFLLQTRSFFSCGDRCFHQQEWSSHSLKAERRIITRNYPEQTCLEVENSRGMASEFESASVPPPSSAARAGALSSFCLVGTHICMHVTSHARPF